MSAFLCVRCGWTGDKAGACPDCDFGGLATVRRDAVTAFPPGVFACPICGRLDAQIVFRGWTRLLSLIVWAREMRLGAYLCVDCARRSTAKNLAFTGVLGWWSLPSLFFYAPRATYHNWRAIWNAPGNPLAWGAFSASEMAASIRAGHDSAEGDNRWLEDELSSSPFAALTQRQGAIVFAAEHLYETLQTDLSASAEEIRAAYVRQAKLLHPDLRPDDPSAAAAMVHLNLAWEILREPKLRVAYDWLCEHRDTVPA